MKKIVLVDIDHTLSDAFWRDPMIGEDWDAYHAASVNDKPIAPMIEIVNAMWGRGWDTFAITARPAKWHGITMDWLLRHDAMIGDILMRRDEDYRPAPEIKLSLARQRFGDPIKNKVSLLIDDRDDVIEAFRAEGVCVLQSFAPTGAQPLIQIPPSGIAQPYEPIGDI